jgi:hypothetical protein
MISPAELIDSSLSSFLLFRLLHDNNISQIPQSFSSWMRQLHVFTTGNNPSECFHVLDIATGETTYVCDCAKGFFGIDYCEPIDALVKLPAYVTPDGNVIHDNRVVNQRLPVADPHDPFPDQSQNFTLQFSNPRVERNVSLYAVTSAFTVFAEKRPPQPFALLSSLRQPTSDIAAVTTNYLVPTNLTYASDRSISGLDLIPTSTGVLINLTPSTSGTFTFRVTATDLFCGESMTVLDVSLEVQDCGNQTCFHGGTCVDQGNSTDGDFACVCTADFKGILCNDSKTDCEKQPCANDGVCVDSSASLFDGKFTCVCASGFQGTLCEVAVARSLLDATAVTGIAVGAFFSLLVLAVAFVAVRIKRRNKARQRKDYHVFISYRVDSDADVAETLCRQLQQLFVESNMKVKCFFDKQDIRDGVDWKNAFLTALEHTCLFVPLISEAAIDRIKALTPESKPDNVLLEYEEAVRLQRERRLAVFPVLIGKRQQDGTVVKFDFAEFGSHQFPKTLSPTKKTGSIADTLTNIFGFQGVFLESTAGMRVYRKSADDHASVAVAERVLLTLLDVAWDSGGKPGSVPGKANWSSNKKIKPSRSGNQRRGKKTLKVKREATYIEKVEDAGLDDDDMFLI